MLLAARLLPPGQPKVGHSADFARQVREAWDNEINVLAVHENDPAKGGCEFSLFFRTTPSALVDEGLYKSIAIALHPQPYREVSIALVAQACGAVPAVTKHLSGEKLARSKLRNHKAGTA